MHGYLLEEDHRTFDHQFFSIQKREAESIDPQQRLLLETVYEGIEAAGYSIDQLRGSQTAVFVGMMNSDYQLEHKRNIVIKAYENFSALYKTLVPEVEPTLPSPIQYGYRTKLTPHFDGPPGSRTRTSNAAGAV